MQNALLTLGLAYLLGSVPFAVVISKLMRLPDPRTHGSGNPGATNVLRSGNKLAALLVLLFDGLKGALAVLLARHYGVSDILLGWVAVAVVLGHIFPIFLKFKGGKGVATAVGSLLALFWPIAVMVMLTWLLVATTFRYSSLAAIIAAIAAILYVGVLHPFVYGAAIVTIAVIVIARHYQNIQRLLHGTEGQIKFKKS